jgi:7,8-dihydro-6-hydroxymethylpterin-pyrophosphokinase
MKSHSALIWTSTDLMAGLDRLKVRIQQLESVGDIARVSAVYKKFLSHRSEDLNSLLVLAIRLNTDLESEQLFAILQSLEKNDEPTAGGENESLTLLAFDQEIRLMPGQNLPHLKLHTDTLTLRCAAETWGEYQHPVLGQSLQDLVRFSDPLKHVEFFAQGRSLFSTEQI